MSPALTMTRRIVQLLVGLAFFGFGIALMVQAKLGIPPWDVLTQGLQLKTGLAYGLLTVLMSIVVLMLWIPIRQKPGLGTVANALLVGIFIEVAFVIFPTPTDLLWRIVSFAIGLVLVGFATGLYIGAGLGPGPRDGLMTGLARRGRSIRVVRTSIEVSVLVLGWLLGGSVGVGTIAYALSIGPLAHVLIPALTVGESTIYGRPEDHEGI